MSHGAPIEGIRALANHTCCNKLKQDAPAIFKHVHSLVSHRAAFHTSLQTAVDAGDIRTSQIPVILIMGTT